MSAPTSYVLRAAVPVLTAATLVACTAGRAEPTAADPSTSAADPGAAVQLADLPVDARLDPGRYTLTVIDESSPAVLPVLSVPDGYQALKGGVGVHADGLARYLWVWQVNSVYAHPCDAGAEPVGPSAADLAEALAAQELRSSSDPVPVTVGGHDGMYVELSVPAQIDVDDCPGGVFGLWPGRAERYEDIRGQVDRIWIVEVDGQRLVFDAAHLPDADPDELADVAEMVTTATFAPAGGA